MEYSVSTLKTNLIQPTTGSIVSIPGHVVQTVQGTLGSTMQSTSSDFSDTGLTATITPKSASSKILVITSTSGAVQDNATDDEKAKAALLRGSTIISQFETLIRTRGGSGGEAAPFSINFSYLDSPNTTSATTYKTQVAVITAEVIYGNLANSTATITLMEIAQ